MNTINYSSSLEEIKKLRLETNTFSANRPSNIVISFLEKYPWLGKNIQTLIDNTNEARVLNLISWLTNVPNKLAKIFDKSNLENFSNIIMEYHSSFIIKNYIKNPTNDIIDAIKNWELVKSFNRTRSFFKNTINSILNTNSNQENQTVDNSYKKEVLNNTNYSKINKRQAIYKDTLDININNVIKDFQGRFKWIEDKLELLANSIGRDKTTELIFWLSLTPIRLYNVIKLCNLNKFISILNNNDDLSVIIKDIKNNKTEDIIYAIRYWKMPWPITKTKLFFKKSILSFLDINKSNSQLA